MLATDRLIVIPCSKEKASGGGSSGSGPSILEFLSSTLAERLDSARNKVAKVAKMLDTGWLPAWERYSGHLYEAAAEGLKSSSRLHLLILSGGYGILHAEEPIRDYDRPLTMGDWPANLLQDVIGAYAEKYGLARAMFFASRTGNYAKILRRGRWREWGLEEVTLYTPGGTRVHSGAQVTVPVALGQGLATLLSGPLPSEWRSRHGLTLCPERLI